MRCYKLFILVILATSCKTHQTEQNIQLKELTGCSISTNNQEFKFTNLDIFDTIIYHTIENTNQTNDYKKPKSAIITRHVKAKKEELKKEQSDNKKAELKETQKEKKDEKKQMKKSSKKSSIMPNTIIIIFLIFVACMKRKR